MVFKNGSDGIVANTGFIPGIVNKSGELVDFVIESIQSQICTDPQDAVAVFVNRPYHVVADAVWPFGIAFINGEFIAVVSIQTIASAEPHKSFAILPDAPYGAFRKPLVDGNVIEFDAGFLRETNCRKPQN